MMSEIKSYLDREQQDKLKKVSFPDWMDPMLATLTDDYFSDENWLYERKLDGERCLIFKSGDKVTLKSRNRKTLNDTYPELAKAIEKMPGTFVADGEIVAFKKGKTSFSRLQKRMGLKDSDEARNIGIKVYLYLFDLMYLDDFDLTNLELKRRKELLKQNLEFQDPIRYSIHRTEEGEAFHEEACRKGWEGIIAKDSRAPYEHSRSKKWLKFKCTNRQEFVVGGYTDPKGERIGFGALLLGFYENDQLKYAGQVGTGFSNDQLKEMHNTLSSLERKTSPFSDENIKEKNVHWVRPSLVAEVAFTEWTDNDKLRHPKFLGLRDDKEAEDVHKEKP